jgi:hypothetical protein
MAMLDRKRRRTNLRPGRDAAREGGGFGADSGGALLDDEETVGRGVIDFEVDAESSAVGTVLPADNGQDGLIIEETDALHLNVIYIQLMKSAMAASEPGPSYMPESRARSEDEKSNILSKK